MQAPSPEIMPPGTPQRLSPDISQHEPPMYIPRPSSDRAQDVSHILASVFKDLYTRDVMSKDTVNNLTRSSEGSTKFHKKCMEQLAKVHADHQKKLQEYNMVEKHIIQARANATAADEKALNHVAGDIGSDEYEKLGLPPVQSHFRWCVEEEKLKSHKLIVPSDLFTEEHQLMDGPKKPHTPHFSVPTMSSSLHFSKEKFDDGYTDGLDTMKEVEFVVEDDDRSFTTLSSDSADLTSVPPRSSIAPKVKSQTAKNRWRENMKHETRIEDRALLARLEERHNFLKNPRYLPLSEPKASKLLTKEQPKKMVLKAGREVVKEISSDEDVQVFASNPAIVKFTEWTVGRVYEATLELRNVSAVSRQMRVLPPKTSFFSLGLGKYPGSDGFVAPGMSAQYCIRFMPDSLADYNDEVEILSQSACPLVVEIQAKRTPPVLTMADNIQCGFCLVGGVKVTELSIKNMGGNGRFCILRKSSWPASNFKTLVNPSCLDLGVFQIRPAVFEVLAGQTTALELIFSPGETDKYKEELVMVCDNCQVKQFTIQGEGQSAAVELVSVSDGGEEEPHVGEVVDLTADHLIRFPPLNPHSFYMRQIIVHNSTNVEMPFSWHVLKPNLTSALDSLATDKDGRWEKFDFYPDNSSAFYIEPRVGILQANGIHEFVATFAPQQIGEYNNVMHLVLSNIPDPKRDVTKPKSAFTKSEANCAISAESPTDKRDESAPRLTRSTSSAQSSSVARHPSLREVIALEIQVKGHSVPYSVVVHPPAVVVPGNMLVGATTRRPMRMANYSMAPVEFEWSSETVPNIVEVEPPVGIVNPGEIAELEVTITGSKPGPLECVLNCKIKHQEEPLSLSVNANISGPNVVMDNLQIDFGLVKPGSSACEKLFIRNTTQLNASWKLTKPEHHDTSELLTWPSSGTLPPLGQQEVKVHFRPTAPSTLNTVLNLQVDGGQSSSVAVKGEVQTQQACFAECTLVLQETFLSVPKSSRAVIINQTLFPTAFSFSKPLGKQANSCDVTVTPDKGVLAPREERAIEVTLASHVTGEVTDVYVPCKIEGMNHPIVLGFYAFVKDLSVDYATPGTEGKELKVEFGGEVRVRKVATSKVVVTNLSAIRAPWSAEVENFPCHTTPPRQVSMDFKSYRTRRMMLGRTPNLADPLAKTAHQAHEDHAKLMLEQGRGAAFLVEPDRGFLEPYQSQEITVSAFSDMWGEYRDTLSCRIEGLDEKRIPVELNVSGCPLSFQVASHEDKDAVVRFGTHLEGGASVARKLRVNNRSSCDIRLDWRTYNYPEPDDQKVIDLNIWFGDIFPLKVTKGRSKVSVTKSLGRMTQDEPEETPSTQDLSARTTSTQGFYSKLPKLVTVRIDPHFGQQSDRPFHMQPPQVIVPAHGHVIVTSVFHPLMGRATEGRRGKEWRAYSHGFMTLDSPEKRKVDGKLERIHGLEKIPLRLELTAFVQAGMLQVETDDEDEGSRFYLPLSNVVDPETKELRESVQIQAITLVNPTETSLSFNLLLSDPFFFPTASGKSQCLPRNTLKPQSNLKMAAFQYIGLLLPLTWLWQSLACPISCRCPSVTTVSCVNNELQVLPANLSNSTTHLYMSRNNISNEGLTFAELSMLEEVDLSYNYITSLRDASLGTLVHLKVLRLDHNELIMLSRSDYNIFKGLLSLQLLSLSHNKLAGKLKFSKDYNLPRLKHLDLSNNIITSVGRNSFFTSVQHLNLSNNRIEAISPSAFLQTASLQFLDLTGINMGTFPADRFQTLKNLTTLIIGGTDLEFVSSGILTGLTGLLKFQLSDSTVQALPKGIFSDTANMTYLSLSGNDLTEIPYSALNGTLRFLQHLDVSFNNITNFSYPLFIPSLLSLNLSDNPVGYFDQTAISNLTNLERLDLSGTSITKLDTTGFHNALIIISQLYISCDCQSLRTHAVLFASTTGSRLQCRHNAYCVTCSQSQTSVSVQMEFNRLCTNAYDSAALIAAILIVVTLLFVASLSFFMYRKGKCSRLLEVVNNIKVKPDTDVGVYAECSAPSRGQLPANVAELQENRPSPIAEYGSLAFGAETYEKVGTYQYNTKGISNKPEETNPYVIPSSRSLGNADLDKSSVFAKQSNTKTVTDVENENVYEAI